MVFSAPCVLSTYTINMKTKGKPTEYSAWGKDRYKITTQKVPSSASHHLPNGLQSQSLPPHCRYIQANTKSEEERRQPTTK